jgi:hypothetical protein
MRSVKIELESPVVNLTLPFVNNGTNNDSIPGLPHLRPEISK